MTIAGLALRVAILALACALPGACVPVTVNINFPQEKLDDAASQIVDMSRGPAVTPPAPDPSTAPKPGSSLERWLAPFGPREASAEERPVLVAQALKTDTPEQRRLAEAQRQRLPALQQWMARGCIGENNQGFVEARPGQGCGGDVARIIGDENRDRQAVVDALMRENSIPASDAPRIKASFARVYRNRAGAGEWIQTDGGNWAKK
jgi:uncharacterized protein YdbL (DUF1318 family)